MNQATSTRLADATGEVLAVPAGEILAGKYRVERLLAAGGMGVVVQATHLDLDRAVALKFIRGEHADNPELAERFALEARAAARLKSEHACRVLDVGRLDTGTQYIVMELLEGEDLAARLARDGRLPTEQAIDWLLQASEAVAEAHSLGIVHRDLKPENLFLARQPDGSLVVKVLDFGISQQTGRVKRSRSLTAPSAIMGSPHYMAPEQMLASPVDQRADIWALGVILFELLSGRCAFEGDTVPEICAQVIAKAPTSLASLGLTLPPKLERGLLRCLAKDPAQRHATVAALAEALCPFGSAESRRSADRISALVSSEAASAPSACWQQSTDGAIGQENGFESDPRAELPPPHGTRWAAVSGVMLGLAVLGAGTWWTHAARGRPSDTTPTTVSTLPAESTSRALVAKPAATQASAQSVATTATPTATAPAGAAPSETAFITEKGEQRRSAQHKLGRATVFDKKTGPRRAASNSQAKTEATSPGTAPSTRPGPTEAWDVNNFGERR